MAFRDLQTKALNMQYYSYYFSPDKQFEFLRD